MTVFLGYVSCYEPSSGSCTAQGAPYHRLEPKPMLERPTKGTAVDTWPSQSWIRWKTLGFVTWHQTPVSLVGRVKIKKVKKEASRRNEICGCQCKHLCQQTLWDLWWVRGGIEERQFTVKLFWMIYVFIVWDEHEGNLAVSPHVSHLRQGF